MIRACPQFAKALSFRQKTVQKVSQKAANFRKELLESISNESLSGLYWLLSQQPPYAEILAKVRQMISQLPEDKQQLLKQALEKTSTGQPSASGTAALFAATATSSEKTTPVSNSSDELYN